MKQLTHPSAEEYNEFYNGYVQRAIARKDVIATLPKQIDEIRAALGKLTDKQALFRDAPKEWTIKEVLGHINDAERIFAYRLLRVSRNDQTPLPGFEQNDYVREAGFDNYPLADLLDEFERLRRANMVMIQNMPEAYADRRGIASGFSISARALVYMLVGHVDHHMASLHEKYLSTAVKL